MWRVHARAGNYATGLRGKSKQIGPNKSRVTVVRVREDDFTYRAQFLNESIQADVD
jgi:hypothetical protein